MPDRYDKRLIFTNDNELYDSLFDARDVNYVRHYATPEMNYPDPEEIRNLTRVRHVWKTGDRYFKLSIQYYNSPRYWWVIAWWNSLPTEALLKNGDLIYIPLNLEETLRVLGT